MNKNRIKVTIAIVCATIGLGAVGLAVVDAVHTPDRGEDTTVVVVTVETSCDPIAASLCVRPR